MHSVSPRRRKIGREANIQAADSMSAAICMLQIKPEGVSPVPPVPSCPPQQGESNRQLSTMPVEKLCEISVLNELFQKGGESMAKLEKSVTIKAPVETEDV
jgi:hypothetical protein